VIDVVAVLFLVVPAVMVWRAAFRRRSKGLPRHRRGDML